MSEKPMPKGPPAPLVAVVLGLIVAFISVAGFGWHL